MSELCEEGTNQVGMQEFPTLDAPKARSGHILDYCCRRPVSEVEVTGWG